MDLDKQFQNYLLCLEKLSLLTKGRVGSFLALDYSKHCRFPEHLNPYYSTQLNEEQLTFARQNFAQVLSEFKKWRYYLIIIERC
jgi:hypothetical protein